MKKLFLKAFSVIFLSGLLTSTTFAAIADESTQDANSASRKGAQVSFFYTPENIYRIYCQPGYLTDIKLQAGEEINFIGGGDTVRWIIDTATSGSGKNLILHLYIKPVQSGVDTNLIVNTNRRSYHMQIVAANTYTPIVGWDYPQEEKIEDQNQKTKNGNVEKPQRVFRGRLNYNYKIDQKKYDWAPEAVFDDGRKTYIQMPAMLKTAEAPVLFVKLKKDVVLVNYRVKDNLYIVDRLFNEAEMRNGKEIVRIKKINEVEVRNDKETVRIRKNGR